MRFFHKFLTSTILILNIPTMQISLFAKINPSPTQGIRSIIYHEAVELDATNPEPIYGALTINSSNNLHYYALANNVNSPIIIDDNCITLDLKGYRIQGGGANGIHINSGIQDIFIYNGTIAQCMNGIYADAGCSNLSLHNITVRNCSNAGIYLKNCEKSRLESCSMIANGTYGFLLENSEKITVDNCLAQENHGVGFALYNSSHNNLKCCKAVATINDDDSAYAFYSEGGIGNVFDNCYAEDTETASIASNHLAVGFMLQHPEIESIIQHCTTTRTIAPDNAQAYGIYLKYTFTQLDEFANKLYDSTSIIRSVAWSPDRHYIAVDGYKISGTECTGFVEVLQFDPTASAGNHLVPIQQKTYASTCYLYSVAWSPDGHYLAIGGHNNNTGFVEVLQFDPTASVGNRLVFTEQKTYSASSSLISSVAWSPDGNYLAIGGIHTSSIGFVEVLQFDPTASVDNRLVFTEQKTYTPSSVIYSVAWSPDGHYLAIGGQNNSITGFVEVVQFDPTASVDNRLVFIEQKTYSASSSYIYSVAWSPDGHYLAVGGYNNSGTGFVEALQFDPTALAGNRLVFIQQKTYTPSPSYIYSVTWSPDGHYLAVGGKNNGGTGFVEVLQFDPTASAGNRLVFIQQKTYTLSSSEIYSVAWSPDGHYLAIGGRNNGAQGLIDTNRALLYPERCILQSNLIHGTKGGYFSAGIEGENIGNLVIRNTAYANDRDYGTAIYHVHTGYGSAGTVDNIALSNL